MDKKILLNVGCGNVRPVNWVNTDSSINALVQKVPLIGKLAAKTLIKSSIYLSDNFQYMNLNKYWKFKNESVDVVYASHIFEHLNDRARKIFFEESFRVLKTGGTLRIVVPDLFKLSKKYVFDYESSNKNASHSFMHSLNLHQVGNTKNNLKNIFKRFFNWLQKYPHLHKYMYDQFSLKELLHNYGFKNINIMEMGKSDGIKEISDVEANRDTDISLYIECNK